MNAACVANWWKRLRRIWAPQFPVTTVPPPSGAEEDRESVEDEKNEFAKELHHMRQRVHFLEIMAKVRQRGKDTGQ